MKIKPAASRIPASRERVAIAIPAR